jgi:hypothetical protein
MHIENKNKIGTSDLQTTPKLSIKSKKKIVVSFEQKY